MAEPTQNSILRITDEKTIQLIELYEKEQCLWNTTIRDYKHRDRRAKAAERVARKLNIKNFEAKHVMIKFKNLRNSYCQELKKIAHSINFGEAGQEAYQPRVFWFAHMDKFLRPHLQPCRSGATLAKLNEPTKILTKSEPNEEIEEWVQMSNPEDVIDQSELNYPQSSDHEDDRPLKRVLEDSYHEDKPKRNKLDEDVSHILREISLHLRAVTMQKDDHFDSFGKYIATLLRTLPLQKALELQPRIVGLVTSEFSTSELRVSQSDESV